jgi:cobalt/nickel transport system permease protein
MRDLLEPYARIASPIHRLPAGLKLGLALIMVMATVITPLSSWSMLAAIAALLAASAVLCRVPMRLLVTRLLILEPLVLGIAVLSLFRPGGRQVFATIVIRSTLCLSTMIILSSTTSFAEMLRTLRKLRVPTLLLTTIALMVRYLFVLVDETERMQRARAARTFTGQPRRHWRTLATVAGRLLVRSTERAERIYAAMAARGWK